MDDEHFDGRDGSGDAGPPSDQFYRFLRSGHVLRSLLREFLEEDFLRQVCRHRLTRSQFCFLKLITANSELQVGELARCLGVSPAASSKSLDRLERLGLVFRETSDRDRRAILLKASAEGEELVRDYENLKAARLEPVIDSLGREKTKQLCDLLEEVCVEMLARAENPRETCLRCAGYYRPNCSFEKLQGACALRPRTQDEERSSDEMEA
ncbi:MAG: MarR family transcriptional regulator [Hyphomicrobiaceae bacterium]|nr:MarR family transcriptional regulator [Hyphomicrobiaceae bacterium]